MTFSVVLGQLTPKATKLVIGILTTECLLVVFKLVTLEVPFTNFLYRNKHKWVWEKKIAVSEIAIRSN